MTAHPALQLPLTGERTLAGVAAANYWFRRHEVGYQELAPHCAGAVVLEAGCGEGYGAGRWPRRRRGRRRRPRGSAS